MRDVRVSYRAKRFTFGRHPEGLSVLVEADEAGPVRKYGNYAVLVCERTEARKHMAFVQQIRLEDLMNGGLLLFRHEHLSGQRPGVNPRAEVPSGSTPG